MTSGKTLILVGEPHGHSHAIARAIGLRMRNSNHRVEVGDLATGANPSPSDYAAVIMGTEAARIRDRRALANFISLHRSALQSIPTGLFVVCNSRESRADPRAFIEAFETAVGWRAQFAAAFQGGPNGVMSGSLRRFLLACLRVIDGSVAARGVDELTALADAMANELARPRFSSRQT